MNDKIKDIVVTIIFLFTVISLFLINVIKEDTDISVAERRKLATMPELTTKSLFDGTYFKKFDSYVTDQFVERDAFRKIKIDIELSTKGEYNNLYLYDDYIIEEIFPLNSNSINNLTSKINYIKDTYLNDNSNIYYTIIPDKNYFVNKGNLKLDYNKLQDMMKSNLTNLNYINIFDKLTKEHNSEEDFKVTENIEEKMDLEGILSTLKYEDAICIVLFYGSGYTIRKISEILKCNENTVKSRINRVKGKIRKNYSKGGMENEISR